MYLTGSKFKTLLEYSYSLNTSEEKFMFSFSVNAPTSTIIVNLLSRLISCTCLMFVQVTAITNYTVIFANVTLRSYWISIF